MCLMLVLCFEDQIVVLGLDVILKPQGWVRGDTHNRKQLKPWLNMHPAGKNYV